KLDKAEEINGNKYVSIDLISFEKVANKEQKAEIVKGIFKDSVVKEKHFLGATINSLYSFFMLFVVMAGVASVILFILSKKLLQMMNGVR
ncbi:MAG: MFS transporter, partial [Bacteroidia bacterium]|nr:MFS transporter [Bacteroidia bacterium]